MDLEKLIRTEKFLEEMSFSIRNILMAYFPELTRQDKEDIDHEVKLKLWKGLTDGKKILNLRSYLWRVVYTTALDVLGERLNSVPLEKVAEIEEEKGISARELLASTALTHREESKLLVEKAVNTLPERRKAVLNLHFSGMSIKQIAASLGWGEGRVRHLLYRGLGDLKHKLREQKG